MLGWGWISLLQASNHLRLFISDIYFLHKLAMVDREEYTDEGSGLELVHLSDVLDVLGES